MEMGHVEQSIVKTSLLNNMPIPERILEAPQVPIEYAFYFDAFFELDSERDYSFGAGPIKWSSIKNYAEYHCLDSDMSEMLFFIVSKLDAVRIRELNKKSSDG